MPLLRVNNEGSHEMDYCPGPETAVLGYWISPRSPSEDEWGAERQAPPSRVPQTPAPAAAGPQDGSYRGASYRDGEKVLVPPVTLMVGRNPRECPTGRPLGQISSTGPTTDLPHYFEQFCLSWPGPPSGRDGERSIGAQWRGP